MIVQYNYDLGVSGMISCCPNPSREDFCVYVVLDACHMVKLVSNLLKEYQVITILNVGMAMWQHVEFLLTQQQSEGLTLVNKLTQQHVHYKLKKDEGPSSCPVVSIICRPFLVVFAH